MRDRMLIFCGLALFVAVFTYPVLRAATAGLVAGPPDMQLPATAKQCVADTPYMRANHMQLLVNWREDVVRRDIRQIHAPNGKVYSASLANTCTGECHAKEQFCDRCHTYSGVSGPYCWDCHRDPRLVARKAP